METYLNIEMMEINYQNGLCIKLILKDSTINNRFKKVY
jgi:hypothetical protein